MKFGIIKERKTPPDRRVVLSPKACQAVKTQFPSAEIIVESSEIRVFKDNDYQSEGFEISENMEQ